MSPRTLPLHCSSSSLAKTAERIDLWLAVTLPSKRSSKASHRSLTHLFVLALWPRCLQSHSIKGKCYKLKRQPSKYSGFLRRPRRFHHNPARIWICFAISSQNVLVGCFQAAVFVGLQMLCPSGSSKYLCYMPASSGLYECSPWRSLRRAETTDGYIGLMLLL